MPNLRPVTRDELTQSPSFALRFKGRKRVRGAEEIMAQIAAKWLIEHLERSGCVVKFNPGLAPHRVGLGDAIERAMWRRRSGVPGS